MKPKDPIWNFYSALNDGKNSRGRCLDCNAEVSGKKLSKKLSTRGRDETVRFFLFFFIFFNCPFLFLNPNRGAVVEWLEQLGYGAESRRIA